MVYESLSTHYPEFLTSSRNYPGLPYRFRTRTIRAVDSTTIKCELPVILTLKNWLAGEHQPGASQRLSP